MRRNSWIISILLLVFWIAQSVIAGNTGKIAGHVSDANSGEPIPGANIVIKGTYLCIMSLLWISSINYIFHFKVWERRRVNLNL